MDSVYTMSSSSSSSSLTCDTCMSWESSSFSHWLPHWQRSVQAKFFVLQVHLAEEQSALHWHLTICTMAFGAGSTSVVVGFIRPSSSSWYPFSRGFSCVSCCAIAACPHTRVWMCTRKMCCFRAPAVGGNLSLSAMCLQNKYQRSSGIVLRRLHIRSQPTLTACPQLLLLLPAYVAH